MPFTCPPIRFWFLYCVVRHSICACNFVVTFIHCCYFLYFLRHNSMVTFVVRTDGTWVCVWSMFITLSRNYIKCLHFTCPLIVPCKAFILHNVFCTVFAGVPARRVPLPVPLLWSPYPVNSITSRRIYLLFSTVLGCRYGRPSPSRHARNHGSEWPSTCTVTPTDRFVWFR